MQVSFTADEIAAIVQPIRSVGTASRAVTGISGLMAAVPGDLSFLGNAKYHREVAATRASVVLVPADYAGAPAADQQFLFMENPSVGLARLCARLEPALWPKPKPGIHATAVIAPGAVVPPRASHRS